MSTGIETEDVGRADPKSALAMIRTHLRPFRIRLVVATGLSLIATLLELVPYVVVWTLLGQVVTGAASTRFFALGAGVALVAVLVGHLSNGLALTQSHIVAFKMLRDLRCRGKPSGKDTVGQGAQHSVRQSKAVADQRA